MPFVNLPADRPFRIGRDARNELQLFDPQVSRFHAQILPAGDGFAVQDLGSTNGMYVNYNRIPPGNTVTLKPGDSIQVGGKWELNFAYDVAAPEPATST
jgi:pSer/pThr/pTyr-binding forkhead associated (FHA) protein